MKLHKVLQVSGKPYVLVKEDIRLDAANAGRAKLTIQAATAVKGLVTLDIGCNERTLQRHFIGFVERCTSAGPVEQVLFCRELVAVLANPLPMNLRHVDLTAVLAQTDQDIGLCFRVPHRFYSKVKAPFFYNLTADTKPWTAWRARSAFQTSSGSSKATTRHSRAVGPTASSANVSPCRSRQDCSITTRVTRAR